MKPYICQQMIYSSTFFFPFSFFSKKESRYFQDKLSPSYKVTPWMGDLLGKREGKNGSQTYLGHVASRIYHLSRPLAQCCINHCFLSAQERCSAKVRGQRSGMSKNGSNIIPPWLGGGREGCGRILRSNNLLVNIDNPLMLNFRGNFLWYVGFSLFFSVAIFWQYARLIV